MCLGIPGRMVSHVEGYGNQLVLVDVAGAQRRVNIGMLEDAEQASLVPGQWVIVHMGFVVELVDEAAAEKAMSGLEMMGRARAEPQGRRRLDVAGDGRPDEYRALLHDTAASLRLSCSVADSETGCLVDIEGEPSAFEEFARSLREHGLRVTTDRHREADAKTA